MSLNCFVWRGDKIRGLRSADIQCKTLVAGGESFTDESLAFLEEVWGVPAYNAYGSTEGTVSGECYKMSRLDALWSHPPADHHPSKGS